MATTSRPDFDAWALHLAAAVATRGDCRRKQVGAVILDARHRVISTGYNGSPPGGPSCLAGECPRAFAGVEPGSSYDTGPGTCIALHAEMNSIIYADPLRLPGATIYITCEPCQGCTRMIAGTGITRTVWAEDLHAGGLIARQEARERIAGFRTADGKVWAPEDVLIIHTGADS